MNRTSYLLLFLTMLVISFINFSCSKEEPIPPPIEQTQSQIDDSLLREYIITNDIDATRDSSGIYYKILADGNDNKPNYSSLVSTRYKGLFTDGTVFDESTSIIQFYLYQVIQGWQYGLPLIGEGGKIKLYIPGHLGYGSTAYGPIPANSILVFEVELVTVTD